MTNINLQEITFEWAHGKDKYDNMPVRMAGTWSEFAKFLRTPLPKVKGKDHFAGPFGNDGRRCDENSGVRQYLPFDLDGITDGDGCLDNYTFNKVTEYFDQYEGVFYETSSSKPGDRCARFILPVSRPINSEESNALGYAITQVLGIANLKWDKSVYKLSQPVYLPVAGRTLIPLGMLGDPKVLNVDETLKNVDVQPKQISSKVLNRIAMLDDPVVKKLQEANLIFKQDSKSLAYDIACPFEDSHSENQYAKDSSTQYFAANTGGFAKGNFKCLHDSCRTHTQQDFLTKLGINSATTGTQEVWLGKLTDMKTTEHLMESIQDTQFAWRKLIPQGHMVILCARAGDGKTTIMVKAAADMAAGGYEVIYINADASADQLKDYHRHAVDNNYTLVAPDLHVGKSVKDVVESLSKLAQTATDLSNMVLFLDTIKKFTDMIQKQKAKDFFNILRSLTTKGMTIVSLGHTNKYNDADGKPIYEGTGDVRNDFDDLIYLVAVKNDVGNLLVSTILDKERAMGMCNETFEIDKQTRGVTIKDQFIDTIEMSVRKKAREVDADLIAFISGAIAFGAKSIEDLYSEAKSSGFSFSKRQVRRVVSENTSDFCSDPLWISLHTGRNGCRYGPITDENRDEIRKKSRTP